MKTRIDQCGFTLVELAVVLLSIIALLLFIYGSSSGVFDDDQMSETKQMAAAFEKSVNAIRMQWSADGGQKDKVEFNGLFIDVTTSGWTKQLNGNVAGCMTVWRSVLANSPEIAVYNKDAHTKGWSAGGGPNVCYFINQQGEPFDEEETPYFRYSYEIGQITRFNM